MGDGTWFVSDLEHLTAIVQELVAVRFSDYEQCVLLVAELRGEHERITRWIDRLMLERERMKFWSARRCWKERHQRNSSGETWAAWFERIYGESLQSFAERAAREGLTQKVLEFELATYGFSPLEKERAA